MKNVNVEEKFLKQSYIDACESYKLSLNNKKINWDWVAITASNDKQAEAYQIQIDQRLESGWLPKETKYLVIPDLDGKRIGSGGATLNVLKYITEKIGMGQLETQKILVIHSGGDSKRIPQYSACGKLFSPIPRLLPNGECATLFDELLMAVSRIPSRVSAGMLTMSGDTELLFNPLQLELFACDAAALSMKANIAEGKDHGVFLVGDSNVVKKFLHKQNEIVLREYGAVDEKNDVDIDTGSIWFGHKIVSALAGLFYVNGTYDDMCFHQFVNEKVRLSFYADFVSPTAGTITWEEYEKETPEGSMSEELIQCRKKIWDVLHKYVMKVVRMAPARYIHIGMTKELFELMTSEIEQYRYLGWQNRVLCSMNSSEAFHGINSYVEWGVIVGDKCYLENCVIKGASVIGEHTVLSGVTANNIQIPDNVVLNCLKQKNGKYICRIYGLEDNPKGSIDSNFLGNSLRSMISAYDIKTEQIWSELPPSIWNAEIYTENETCDEAVQSALLLYRILNHSADIEDIVKWKNSKRFSMQSSFENADVRGMLDVQKTIKYMVLAENFVEEIRQKRDVREVTANYLNVNQVVYELIKEAADNEKDVILCIRLYIALALICRERNCSICSLDEKSLEDTAYEIVKTSILTETFARHGESGSPAFIYDEVVEKLPVRVNFCGSPSDAAPYCLEHGGTMFDGALLLRGEKPIKVIVRRTEEHCFRFVSEDLNSEVVCTDICDIQDCGNPYDTFALHKAVLVASSLIPASGNELSMQKLCEQLGGGLTLITSVDVPKGSGLGTSSILAAAAVKAIHEIFGQEVNEDRIYAEVFAAEQLMNTGGGWQDQTGGLTPGIKYMHADPGIYQKIVIERVHLSDTVKEELQSRFALIFSGQRRLARNVLREEMNQCIRNDKEAIEAVEQIRKTCALMKYELERGNVTGFAKYITEQFQLVKILDEGASNTCIEYIFDCCEDLIDGKAICGAGGGGFLQVILKKGVTKDMLQTRLQETFGKCGVEVWDSTFLYD